MYSKNISNYEREFSTRKDGDTKERESRKKSSLNALDNLRSLYLDYIARGLFGEGTVEYSRVQWISSTQASG